MIDTIKFQLKYESKDFINIKTALEIFDEQFYNRNMVSGNETLIAKQDFLTVKVKKNHLTVDCNLSKMVMRTNQLNLTYDYLPLALETISKKIGIDIYDAKLTKIDFGYNISLDYPVYQYLQLLVDKPSFKKCGYVKEQKIDECLYFTNHCKKILLYDKMRELTKNRQLVHLSNKNKNLLRYEISLSNRLPRIFEGAGYINCRMLLDKNFLKAIANVWYSEYLGITKLISLPKTPLLTCVKDFQSYLMIVGLDSMGWDNGYKILNEDPFFKNNSGIKRRAKAYLKRLQLKPTLRSNNTLVEELNEKVALIYNSF